MKNYFCFPTLDRTIIFQHDINRIHVQNLAIIPNSYQIADYAKNAEYAEEATNAKFSTKAKHAKYARYAVNAKHFGPHGGKEYPKTKGKS